MVNKIGNNTGVSEDLYNVAVKDAINAGYPGVESGENLLSAPITKHVTSKFPHNKELIGVPQLTKNPITGQYEFKPVVEGRMLTGTTNKPLAIQIPEEHIITNYNPAETVSQSKYPSTSLKFYEKPSTLTEAERLGIPKGERNNDKMYGNIKFIRNVGLHDKPGYMPYISNGKIKLSSDENLLANLTTDLPFRTHQNYAYRPGGEMMLISPRALRGQTFLSLDPSDSMVLNKDLTIDPKHVQVITGNKDVARALSQSGITTYTSPKLQIEYNRAMQANPEILTGKIRLDKKILEILLMNTLKLQMILLQHSLEGLI